MDILQIASVRADHQNKKIASKLIDLTIQEA
jgi:predicted N-acetyltransferase YhbS